MNYHNFFKYSYLSNTITLAIVSVTYITHVAGRVGLWKAIRYTEEV